MRRWLVVACGTCLLVVGLVGCEAPTDIPDAVTSSPEPDAPFGGSDADDPIEDDLADSTSDDADSRGSEDADDRGSETIDHVLSEDTGNRGHDGVGNPAPEEAAPRLPEDVENGRLEDAGSRGSEAVENPAPEGLVIAQTVDASGQPHALVLHAPDAALLVPQREVFAVLSGSEAFSITGDAVLGGGHGDWRMTVDSRVMPDAAPLVVVKYGSGSVRERAANPATWAGADEFNAETPSAVSARLGVLFDSVISKAEVLDATGAFYSRLAAILEDPEWMGVLVFNASVPTFPAMAAGYSTSALDGKDVTAFVLGIELSSVGSSSVFAVIDQTWPASDGSNLLQLRAQFWNNALSDFSLTGADAN